MLVEEALEKRYSCRTFDVLKVIPSEKIDRILKAGDLAPYASGGPRRVSVYVPNSKFTELLIRGCNKQKHVQNSSGVVIISGIDTEAKLRSGFPKYVHDCDAAAMCMILQATALGIASCWIGHFQPQAVKQAIELKNGRPTVVIALGYDRNDTT